MKEAMRRVLLFILAAAVMLCHFPAASFASASSEPETIEIIYHFNSLEVL